MKGIYLAILLCAASFSSVAGQDDLYEKNSVSAGGSAFNSAFGDAFLPLAIQAAKAGDYKTAFGLFKPLAEQGNAQAQYYLGVLYAQGNGVAQDYKQAVSWYIKAAEQGLTDAQYNLGVLYGNGAGVPQDYVMSYMWFDVAASLGDVQSKKTKDILLAKMTPAQIKKGQQLAADWLAKHAKRN